MLLDLQGLKIALNGISTKIDSKINKNQLQGIYGKIIQKKQITLDISPM